MNYVIGTSVKREDLKKVDAFLNKAIRGGRSMEEKELFVGIQKLIKSMTPVQVKQLIEFLGKVDRREIDVHKIGRVLFHTENASQFENMIKEILKNSSHEYKVPKYPKWEYSAGE
ncbi:MAG: hypothetical protein NT030_08300 [Candidatus Saganbacteria bacterium]|nr:hypothetical protein [Candidatus Saganbacteria bacterium]